MRIIVTGREGQLARSLSAMAAVTDNLELYALGRPRLDLQQSATMRAAIDEIKPDIIINSAAYTNVDGAEDACDEAFAINARGAGMVAEEAARIDIPIIHLSTDYVFDGAKMDAYRESDAPNPLSEYGRSKLEGEKAVAMTNPRHIIARTAWVFSPYGHNFLKTMLRLSETRREISVVADQFGAPTYAPHLADALLELARKLTAQSGAQPNWGTYHVTGSGEASWHGFAEFIFSENAKRGGSDVKVNSITTAEFPTRAPRPANSRLDCSKLYTTFGLELPHWHEGTRACLASLGQEQ